MTFFRECVCGHSHESLGSCVDGCAPCPDPTCPCREWRAPVGDTRYEYKPGHKSEVDRYYNPPGLKVDPPRSARHRSAPIIFEHDAVVRSTALTLEEIRRHDRGECRC